MRATTYCLIPLSVSAVCATNARAASVIAAGVVDFRFIPELGTVVTVLPGTGYSDGYYFKYGDAMFGSLNMGTWNSVSDPATGEFSMTYSSGLGLAAFSSLDPYWGYAEGKFWGESAIVQITNLNSAPINFEYEIEYDILAFTFPPSSPDVVDWFAYGAWGFAVLQNGGASYFNSATGADGSGEHKRCALNPLPPEFPNPCSISRGFVIPAFSTGTLQIREDDAFAVAYESPEPGTWTTALSGALLLILFCQLRTRLGRH